MKTRLLLFLALLLSGTLFASCYDPYLATQPILLLTLGAQGTAADVWVDGVGAYVVESAPLELIVKAGPHELVWNIATRSSDGHWAYSHYYRETVNVASDRVTYVALGGT